MNESQAAEEGQSIKQAEQANPAVHDEDDPDQSTSPTTLLILGALPASVYSFYLAITVLSTSHYNQWMN